MESIIQADIFFFVTTVCIVFISILFGVVLIRVSKALKLLIGILESLKQQTNDIGQQAEEILEQIRGSFIFNLLFPKKTVKKKKQKV